MTQRKEGVLKKEKENDYLIRERRRRTKKQKRMFDHGKIISTLYQIHGVNYQMDLKNIYYKKNCSGKQYVKN